MAELKTLRGRARAEDGSPVEVLATIFPAQPTPRRLHWHCVVRCPFLFGDEDKRIAGVDADQAVELSEMVLREVLTHRGVEIIDA